MGTDLAKTPQPKGPGITEIGGRTAQQIVKSKHPDGPSRPSPGDREMIMEGNGPAERHYSTATNWQALADIY